MLFIERERHDSTSQKTIISQFFSVIFFSIILISVIIPPISPTHFYISSRYGSDLNNGLSESTAWQSFARANTYQFGKGDVLLLHTGDVFYGPLEIWNVHAGYPNLYFHITSYGDGLGERPLITGNDGVYAIRFVNCQGIRVSGLLIQRASYGLLFHYQTPGAYSTYDIYDNQFRTIVRVIGDGINKYGSAILWQADINSGVDVNGFNVYNNFCNNCDQFFGNGNEVNGRACRINLHSGEIARNTISKSSFNQIFVGRTDNLLIHNNVFYYNTPRRNNNVGSTDIIIGTVDATVRVENNDFIRRGDGCGIDFETAAIGVRVKGNYFSRTHGAGIMIYGKPANDPPLLSKQLMIENNIFIRAGCASTSADRGAISFIWGVAGKRATGTVRNNAFLKCENNSPPLFYEANPNAMVGFDFSGNVKNLLFSQVVVTPTISVNSVTGRITASCTTSGAEIRFSRDASKPTLNAHQIIPPKGLQRSVKTQVINVKAFKSGMYPSETTTKIVQPHECQPSWGGSDCQDKTCNPLCTMPNSYCSGTTCVCNAGWSGSICVIPICTACNSHQYCSSPNVCSCNAGWSGTDCNTPVCSSCVGNTHCSAPGVCSCNVGWAGVNCDSPICDSRVCNVHQYCSAPNTCGCKEGWLGFDCNTPLCAAECPEKAICTNPNICNCIDGWAGLNCEQPSGLCNPLCNIHQVCDVDNKCICKNGYDGVNCYTPICDNPSCNSHQNCTLPNTCTCYVGYTGYKCDIRDCHGNYAGIGCEECMYGFTGETCNVELNDKKWRVGVVLIPLSIIGLIVIILLAASVFVYLRLKVLKGKGKINLSRLELDDMTSFVKSTLEEEFTIEKGQQEGDEKKMKKTKSPKLPFKQRPKKRFTRNFGGNKTKPILPRSKPNSFIGSRMMKKNSKKTKPSIPRSKPNSFIHKDKKETKPGLPRSKLSSFIGIRMMNKNNKETKPNNLPRSKPNSFIGRNSLKNSKNTVKCIQNYVAKRPDELSIKVGDLIRMIQKKADGWVLGELNSKRGFFPGNFAK